MKILMVLDRDFPPDIRVEHEINSLTDAGHQVHLACFDRKNAPKQEKWNKAIIHRKPISNFFHKTSVGCLKFPFYFNFWRSFISELHQEYQFDAIHIHDLPLAQIGAEFKEKHGLQFVLDLHENWPALLTISTHVQGPLGKLLSSDKQWRKYEQKMAQAADSIIVVVEESESRISEFVEDPSKIYVVSNTPVLSELENLRKEITTASDELILFYGGGINKHRGLQQVIKALALRKALPVKAWIVGDGSYLDELRNLSKKLEVEDKVVFWGWKSLDEMTDLMLKSHILLIPHFVSEHTESTIPHKLFQYMLTGKPILATDCTPIKRILNETNSGFIYDYNTPGHLAEQISVIYDKWAKGDELVMEGVQPVLDKYNWAHDEKVLLGIYKERL
jgi:glycosyltransferase involved in cell wall biosynthesis